MHNHLDAMSSEKTGQGGSIGKPLTPPDDIRQRRMVDEEDSKQALSAGPIKDVAQSLYLRGSQASCGEKRSGRACGGRSNQNSRSAYPYAWKE